MLAAAGGLALAACGDDDSNGLVVAPPPAEEADETVGRDDAPVAESDPGQPDDAAQERREIGLTAYLDGFEVDVRAATFEPRQAMDDTPLPTRVVIETVVANLVDQNRTGPSYATLRIDGAVVETDLVPQFIDALGTDEVLYRFEIDPGIGPDDVVLWFEDRDRGNPAAIPLGNSGPIHTLAPIDIEYSTPDPVGDITFDGTTGQVRFYNDEGRHLRGYAYIDLDLAATNTGSEQAELARFEVEVDGVGVTPSGDTMGAGSLTLDPGASTDEAVRQFQFPLYGERITISARRGINDDSFVFLELQVPELADAVPDDVKPTPPG